MFATTSFSNPPKQDVYYVQERISFVVKGNGNVGVGKQNPLGHFDVQGVQGDETTSQFIIKDNWMYLGHTNNQGDFEGISIFYDGCAPIIKIGSTGVLTGNTTLLTVSDNDRYFLFENGSVGMGGITVPTANLHIYAQGTAAGSAPLKFGTSSDLMTNVEAGAFEATASDLFYTTPDSEALGLRKTFLFKEDLMDRTVFFYNMTGDNDLSATTYTDVAGFNYTIPELTVDAVYLFEIVMFGVVISASGLQAITYHMAYGDTATYMRWNYTANINDKFEALTSYVDTQYGNSGVLHETTDNNLIATTKIKGIIKVAANTTARSLKLQHKLQYTPYAAVGYTSYSGSYMKVTRIN
jgi:hypothetical protein